VTAKTANRYYPPPSFDWDFFLHNLRNNLGAVVGFFECMETMPNAADTVHAENGRSVQAMPRKRLYPTSKNPPS